MSGNSSSIRSQRRNALIRNRFRQNSRPLDLNRTDTLDRTNSVRDRSNDNNRISSVERRRNDQPTVQRDLSGPREDNRPRDSGRSRLTPLTTSTSDRDRRRQQDSSQDTQRRRLIDQRRDDSSNVLSTILRKEPNQSVVSELVDLERSGNIDLIKRLYDGGADSNDIRAMLRKESDARKLVELVNLENNGDSKAIKRLLIDDGASYDQIKSMLQKEPNARILHAQIRAESENRVAAIKQLYDDGISSKDITATLKINSSAYLIHTFATRAHPKIQAGSLLFASMKNGKVGSIYFPSARIRMVHKGGPELSAEFDRIRRFAVSPTQLEQYQRWFANNSSKTDQEKLNYFTQLSSAREITNVNTVPYSEDGTKLMEFAYQGGRLAGIHPSRGGAVRIGHNMKQYHINILYNLANYTTREATEVNREYRLASDNRKGKLNTYNNRAGRVETLRNNHNAILNNFNLRRSQVQNVRLQMQTLRNNINIQNEQVKARLTEYENNPTNTNKNNHSLAVSNYASMITQYNNLETTYNNLTTRAANLRNNLNTARQQYQNAVQARDLAKQDYEDSNLRYKRAVRERDNVVRPLNNLLWKWMKGIEATKVVPIRRDPNE